jgi:hypothetical protein
MNHNSIRLYEIDVILNEQLAITNKVISSLYQIISMDKNEKEIILQLLEKEPRGLTIQDISRMGNMNRFTSTMYMHELLGEGKVEERKVGAYRLFKLKQSQQNQPSS